MKVSVLTCILIYDNILTDNNKIIIKRDDRMLDRTSSTPLWEQLEDILREQIDNGEWTPGEAITSENLLCKEYNLSRMTVRSVITRLVQEGLLYRVPGKGTFVSEPKIATTPLPYMGIREQLEKKGYEIKTQVLRNEPVKVTERVAKKLNIEVNSTVHLIERVRYIKDKTLSVQRSYLKHNFDPPIEISRLETEQLCNILNDDYNITPNRVEETLEMVYSTSKLAKRLLVPDTYPLLYLQHVRYMDSEIVEYSEVFFKGDQVRLYFEYDGLKK